MDEKRFIWTVGWKLTIGFAVVILLAIIVGLTGLFAMNVVDGEVQDSTVQARVATLSNLIGISMLEARGQEKNFYINYGTLGIQQAKEMYQPQIDHHVALVNAYTAEGVDLARTEENQIRFNEISGLIQQYNTQFDQVVAMVEQRGYRDTGLEGEFLQKAAEFQQAMFDFGHEELIIDVLQIRANGKDYVLYRDAIHAQGVEDGVAVFQEHLQALGNDEITPANRERFITLSQDYVALSGQLAELDLALKAAIEQNGATINQIDAGIAEIRGTAQDLFEAAVDSADQTIFTASTVEVSVLVVAALLGFTVAFFLSRNISRPIGQLTSTVSALANGDLDRRAEITSQDELGKLATAFNQMAANIQSLVEGERGAKEYLEHTVNDYVDFVGHITEGDLTARISVNGSNDPLSMLGRNLNQMVERLSDITVQIREATNNITSASAEILSATTQQASGANEQSAAISQTTSTISEVQAVVEQSYQKAQIVAEKARRSDEISQSGRQVVQDTIDGMHRIKEKVAGIAENILALSEQTQQIGEITASVNEIAAQSNLLALNASVEAARAGEHGKGFAVVAVEVRNLAEQSKQATSQVKSILNEIQQATNFAVMATEEGTKGVDSGVELTEQTDSTIEQLTKSITESANAARLIVSSAQQQTTGIEQISLAMQNINQATMQNLASTRQTERSAQDLSAVARQLDSLVARYKLN